MYFFRRKIFIPLLCLIIFSPIVALAGPGRTGAQILNLGGGARARALGDAFSAMSGDVTTSLWNPSGLADMPESKFRSGRKAAQASMFYTDYSAPFGEAGEGLYYTFISGAMPLGDVGTIGATLQLQGQGTIAVTTDSPDILREESLGTNFALTFSYADRITESLSAGINGKMIRMVLGRENGSSYAVDLGMQYLLPFEPIPTTLGVAIQNVGPGISFIDENQADPLPRFLRIGTSMSLYRAKYHHIRLVSGVTAYIDKLAEDAHELAVDLDRLNAEREEKLTHDQLLSDRGVGIRAFEWRHLQKNLGLEYWLGNLLAIRVGYKIEPGINLPNLTDYFTGGIGVKVYLFNLDLSYGPSFGPNNQRLIEATGIIVF
ncbi:MAG: PorV/PorQ family protein [Candidatus Poribacteria bacterium]|nr:PorV/PorQ family protein [Candidatus Poribacteria bacterium]